MLQLSISLKVQKQISRGHSATGKEVGGHSAVLEIVGRISVGKDVQEELSAWLQRPSDLGHEELVVLHMLEHL